MARGNSLRIARERPRDGALTLNDGPAVVLAPAVARLLKARQPLDVAVIYDDVPPQFHAPLAVHVAQRPGLFPPEVARSAIILAGLPAIKATAGPALAKSLFRRYGLA